MTAPFLIPFADVHFWCYFKHCFRNQQGVAFLALVASVEGTARLCLCGHCLDFPLPAATLGKKQFVTEVARITAGKAGPWDDEEHAFSVMSLTVRDKGLSLETAGFMTPLPISIISSNAPWSLFST